MTWHKIKYRIEDGVELEVDIDSRSQSRLDERLKFAFLSFFA